MKRRNLLALLLGLLFVGIVSSAHAVMIHDVVIGNTSLPPVDDTGTIGCAKMQIADAALAADYGNFQIASVDKANPAYIVAIENGASNCLGIAADSVRDRLLLWNADIIVKQSGANLPLMLDYRADFGSSPDGYAAFSGYMKGTFKKDNVGFTCTTGATCKVTFDTEIYSQYDGLWHQLQQVSATNPLSGYFNKAIPQLSIQMGNGLARTHHSLVTVYLPWAQNTEYKLSVKSTDTFTSTNQDPGKPKTDKINKADDKSLRIDPGKYYPQFKNYKGGGPDEPKPMPPR